MARLVLELRDLGRHPWRHVWPLNGRWAKIHSTANYRRRYRWRSPLSLSPSPGSSSGPYLGDAVSYCDVEGFGTSEVNAANAALIGGKIYTTYHIGTLIIAALFVWFGRQTWDFTRTITWPKLVVITACFTLSIILLAATSFHPFIYFIF